MADQATWRVYGCRSEKSIYRLVTSLTDAGKPEFAAAAFEPECAPAGSHSLWGSDGAPPANSEFDATPGSGPGSWVDGQHEFDIAGNDGTCAYRNQADGVYDADASTGAVEDEAQTDGTIRIRSAEPNDIGAILAVVRACAPYLTPHESYLYWMEIRHWRESCAVAEQASRLVGWCSVLRVAGSRYFIHQLAVAADVRRRGVGQLLLHGAIEKLRVRQPSVQIELTIDRRNRAAQRLFREVARQTGMRVRKTSETVALLEEDCSEELYLMTPIGARTRKG
jgi:ribosomal protein S18 acetylase RimI-like enzyme